MDNKKILGEQGIRQLLTSMKNKIDEKTENISWDQLKNKPFESLNLAGVSSFSAIVNSPTDNQIVMSNYSVNFDYDCEWIVTEYTNATIGAYGTRIVTPQRIGDKLYFELYKSIPQSQVGMTFTIEGNTLKVLENLHFSTISVTQRLKSIHKLDSKYLDIDGKFGGDITVKDTTMFGGVEWGAQYPLGTSVKYNSSTNEVSVSKLTQYYNSFFPFHSSLNLNNTYKMGFGFGNYDSFNKKWNADAPTMYFNDVYFKFSESEHRYYFNDIKDNTTYESDEATICGYMEKQSKPQSTLPTADWEIVFTKVDPSYIENYLHENPIETLLTLQNSNGNYYWTDNGDGTYTVKVSDIRVLHTKNTIQKIDSKYLSIEEYTEDEITTLVNELLTD